MHVKNPHRFSLKLQRLRVLHYHGHMYMLINACKCFANVDEQDPSLSLPARSHCLLYSPFTAIKIHQNLQNEE